MLKLAGISLLMIGCMGLGISKVSEEKRRIRELREIQRMMLRLRNEIVYGKRTLPEICAIFGECMEEPYKRAFAEIFRRLEENDGSILYKIWKDNMKKCVDSMPLKEDEKAVLINIPAYLGILDESAQAADIGESADMVQERIRRAEAEYENKSRVIMSISLMAGLFLTILLL